MRRAIELAERGWGRVSPNPLVGAIVVQHGRIVGEGWHGEYGQAHAEIEALRAAGEQARGATIYVTLEPCAHHGKTPPCTEAVLAAGVARLVFANNDADPAAKGGAGVLRDAGVEVAGGVEADRARALNGPFFRRHQAGARLPWVELKLALSVDGRFADLSGASHWITGEAARAEVHRLRAGHDAIAVGIGTALLDDPLLTARGEIQPRKPPDRIIFDRRLRLPLESRLVRTAREVPLRVVTTPDASHDSIRRLEREGVQIVIASGLAEGLESLFHEGVASILCEGGALLGSALLAEDLVDRLTLFRAPILLGGQAPDAFVGVPSPALSAAHRWKLVRSVVLGDDTLVSLDR
jgi:diaminohydroxyphosphoribosylaminopyrimidine deaminase / 5-amino-6-(5-phosphoribosylamino)uracil reductase